MKVCKLAKIVKKQMYTCCGEHQRNCVCFIVYVLNTDKSWNEITQKCALQNIALMAKFSVDSAENGPREGPIKAIMKYHQMTLVVIPIFL